MKITKNDVGRFAVTRGGSILEVAIYDDEDEQAYCFSHWYLQSGKFHGDYSIEDNRDLIQWADEHPIYKAVFKWPTESK